MKAKNRKRLSYLAVLVFFLVLSFVIAVFTFHEMQKSKVQAQLVLDSYQDKIMLNLQQSFNYTDELSLAMLGQKDTAQFNAVAERILKRPACIAVGYVEGLKMSYVHSLKEEYNNLEGDDITSMNYAYTLARLTGRLTVEGPVTQFGQQVFLIINPLFKHGSDAANAYEGEAAVVLDSQAVLESFKLEELVQSGYAYELWSVHPMDGSKQTIARSFTNADLSGAIETKFQLPTVWTLSIIPIGGWLAPGTILLSCIFSIGLTLCFSRSLYFYRQKKDLEATLISRDRHDPETGFLRYEYLTQVLSNWLTTPDESFAVIYIVLDNYVHLTRLCSIDQRSDLMNHIIESLNDYIKEEHIVARVGESDYIIALRDSLSMRYIENIKKGLMIELIKKVTIEEEKFYLQAEGECSQFPANELTIDELCQSLIWRYHNRNTEETL